MPASHSTLIFRPNTNATSVNTERLGAIDAAAAVVRARSAGDRIAVVTAVHGAASGLRIVLDANGESRGSFGDAALDRAAHELAMSTLVSGTPGFLEAQDAFLFCEPH